MTATVQLRITHGAAKGKVFTIAVYNTFVLCPNPDCYLHKTTQLPN